MFNDKQSYVVLNLFVTYPTYPSFWLEDLFLWRLKLRKWLRRPSLPKDSRSERYKTSKDGPPENGEAQL